MKREDGERVKARKCSGGVWAGQLSASYGSRRDRIKSAANDC